MTHYRTAQKWKAEVEKALEKDIEALGEDWNKIWKRIESSKKGHIDVANEEEEEDRERPGAGLRYLLEIVEQEIDNYYYYASLKQGPRLPAQRGSPKLTPAREAPPDRRFRALSDIIAVLADKEEEIQAFRQEVLNGQLLRPEEVPEWIESTRKKEGLSLSVTFKVVQHKDWEEEVLKQAQALATKDGKNKSIPWVGYEREVLSYVDLDSEYQKKTPINETGILGRLKRLAKKYESFWPEAWAVHFILTGEAYPVSQARVDMAVDVMHGMHRVTLRVSPHLTGDKVRDLYLDGRKRLFDTLRSPRNSRRLTEKHARLAAFAVKTPGPWSRKLKKWNAKYPKWKYNHRSTFARDCRVSYERITGWEWKND